MGGPNCVPILVFNTSTLALLSENCLGIQGDNIFSPLLNDLNFFPNSSTDLISAGGYIDYIGGTNTLILLSGTLDTSGIFHVQKLVRSNSLITA